MTATRQIDATPLAHGARWLMLALLWAIGVAAFEISGLPWPQFGASRLIRFALHITAGWAVVGLLVAAYGSYAVPRWPTAWVLLGWIALAPCAAWLYYAMVTSGLVGRPHIIITNTATYSYLLWTALFYGTLFIAWRIAAERAETTRRLLAEAEIARHRGEAELGRAQLLALRGHVDPALVLDVMAHVQRRYRVDPEAGDRLLDLLVAFLRSAMPAVRSGSSTLAAEVALVRAWAALSRERDPGRATWEVVAPDRLPELAFPPLLLLPILEQLGAAGPAQAPRRLHVNCDGHARLEVHAPDGAPPLDPTLAFRLRVGLQTVHGTRWSLALHDGPSDAVAGLTVTIPLDESSAVAPAPARVDASPHPPTGVMPWTMIPATTTT